MTTGIEALQKQAEADRDERSLHRKVQWFIDKWTVEMDLNKRDASEFSADFVMVIQAVHADTSRTTHELLARTMSAMPPPTFIVKKD